MSFSLSGTSSDGEMTTDTPLLPETFIGGMRILYDRNPIPRLWWPGTNATRPLAKLLLDDKLGVVRVQLRARWLLWLIPAWEARLDSVTAEAFGRSGFTRGVLLRAPDRPPAIFWCGATEQQRILDALRVRS